ncbi:uncharacterized protein J8A68_000156 [[Candida] subhashii]|uniref:CoA-binding domain-containing protein n=1 Tax=[Candida] subhashii TaxID=561895 RepID=A0A8J5V5X2_9ASCO|nr:uncharacterized protein J8A68_000156 [[Candida] subhashii]KAG7666319.1 hypothetical protein J8A68_000156 [[Candida] subhashii]
MSVIPTIKAFFNANRQYAIVGASNNPTKYGYKILAWYLNHNLSIIPINPKEQEILGTKVVNNINDVVKAIASHQDILTYKTSSVDGLSISFLTPPKITRATVQDIGKIDGYKDVIKGLWFQPGSYDQEVLDAAQDLGVFEKVIHEGNCILVSGENGMRAAGL